MKNPNLNNKNNALNNILETKPKFYRKDLIEAIKLRYRINNKEIGLDLPTWPNVLTGLNILAGKGRETKQLSPANQSLTISHCFALINREAIINKLNQKFFSEKDWYKAVNQVCRNLSNYDRSEITQELIESLIAESLKQNQPECKWEQLMNGVDPELKKALIDGYNDSDFKVDIKMGEMKVNYKGKTYSELFQTEQKGYQIFMDLDDKFRAIKAIKQRIQSEEKTSDIQVKSYPIKEFLLTKSYLVQFNEKEASGKRLTKAESVKLRRIYDLRNKTFLNIQKALERYYDTTFQGYPYSVAAMNGTRGVKGWIEDKIWQLLILIGEPNDLRYKDISNDYWAEK